MARWDLSQGYNGFNIRKINVICHNDILKKKYHLSITGDTQEAFDKSQQLHFIKILSKLEIERNFPNLIKGMYKKPTAKVILSAERLKETFSLRSRAGQVCL